MEVSMNATDLRARGGMKWTFYPDDVLAAWVAEMDFGLAPEIATALHAAVDRADTAYHYPALEEQVALAACGFWKDRFGWEVAPDRVFSVPDVVEGIRRAIVHLTAPGSPVVLHTPVYYPFFSMVDRAARQLVEVSCSRDDLGYYRLDLDAIAGALASGAGSIVLCNPWNPTGRVFSGDEIAGLLDVAAVHGARVIADEVHAPLVRAGARHVPAASLDPETVITVTSASKGWNVPGLKCAQVVLTNDNDVDAWADYFTVDKVGVGTFGLIANAAAYTDAIQWLDEVNETLEDNRHRLDNLMATRLPQVGYTPPEATYLAWLDFGSYGLDDPARFLLEKARVALTSGTPFGVGGRGHARLNFATPATVLEEMVDRIAQALASVGTG